MPNDEISKGLMSQLIASLYMLKDCIDRCPNNEWNGKHNDYPFSQVVFHALFDCDINLSKDENDLKGQLFHLENRKEFGNYEELENRIRENLYKKEFISKYYEHCLCKIRITMINTRNDELIEPNSDFYKSMTKMERLINCIRHTQHHAAQLGLRLQILTDKEMDWVGRVQD
jgi:hypothetical protein